MDVLVLSWDAATAGGPSVPAAGLAAVLADEDHDVRLVTRLAEGERPARVAGCEVHAVPDAAPVVPDGFGDRALRVLSFAGPALAVTARRLRERPADLTLAVGTDPSDVARRLTEDAGAIVLTPAGVDDRTVAVAADLARSRQPAAVIAQTSGVAAELARRVPLPVVQVPAVAPPTTRRVGPGPDAPVRLALPTTSPRPRAAARRLRLALAARGHGRSVTIVARRAPVVTVAVAPADLDQVLVAAAAGTPVVVVRGRGSGPAEELVATAGHGVVVDDERAAVDACAALLDDPAARATHAAAGRAAAATARRAAGPALATALVAARRRPRLHAVE